MTYVWAYLAGLATFINPCVLPLLPITLAAALQASRLGPLALAGGLVLSFVVIGVGVSAFGHGRGIDQYLIGRIAAASMILFGLVLITPRLQDMASVAPSPLARLCRHPPCRGRRSRRPVPHRHPARGGVVAVHRPHPGRRDRPRREWGGARPGHSHPARLRPRGGDRPPRARRARDRSRDRA